MTERIWTEEVPKPGSRVALGSAELEMVEVPDIWQITGNIAGFAAAHPAPEIGLGGNLAPDGPALIRLGRDKALWRSGQSARPAGGWHSAGWAALPVTDAWVSIAVTGGDPDNLIRRLIALDLVDGSPSAAVLCAERLALILRDGAGWQIWCAASEVWILWHWLGGAVR